MMLDGHKGCTTLPKHPPRTCRTCAEKRGSLVQLASIDASYLLKRRFECNEGICRPAGLIQL